MGWFSREDLQESPIFHGKDRSFLLPKATSLPHGEWRRGQGVKFRVPVPGRPSHDVWRRPCDVLPFYMGLHSLYQSIVIYSTSTIYLYIAVIAAMFM